MEKSNSLLMMWLGDNKHKIIAIQGEYVITIHLCFWVITSHTLSFSSSNYFQMSGTIISEENKIFSALIFED